MGPLSLGLAALARFSLVGRWRWRFGGLSSEVVSPSSSVVDLPPPPVVVVKGVRFSVMTSHFLVDLSLCGYRTLSANSNGKVVTQIPFHTLLA